MKYRGHFIATISFIAGRGTQQQKEAGGGLQGLGVDDGDEQQDEGGRPQADEEGAGRRQGAAEGRRRGGERLIHKLVTDCNVRLLERNLHNELVFPFNQECPSPS